MFVYIQDLWVDVNHKCIELNENNEKRDNSKEMEIVLLVKYYRNVFLFFTELSIFAGVDC